MNKILIFDDRFGARSNLCEKLTDAFQDEIELTTCKDVFQANDAIEKDKYQVIIVDSMMSTLGLSSEQEKYSGQGLLTGIVWLCGLNKHHPEKLKDSLIYIVSGYLDDYKGAIDSLNEYTQNSDFIKTITFVPKTAKEIKKMILDIEKRLKI